MLTENDRAGVESDSSSDGVTPLTVPPESGGINLGALHRLVVPEENIDDIGGGEDLDFSQSKRATIRRPGEQKWFALNAGYWMRTRLVEVDNPAREYGVDWHCVKDPVARSLIRGYLRDVMAVPCYLLKARVWTIWIVRIGEHKWWFEVEPLFRKAPEFYKDYAFRVKSGGVPEELNGRRKPLWVSGFA